jgi:hypothetical protein
VKEARRSHYAAIEYFTPGIVGMKKKKAYINANIDPRTIGLFRTAFEQGYRMAAEIIAKGSKP